MKNFELRLRLSNETKVRWNQDFVKENLGKMTPIQRVWVCGPPVMNEDFDKTLENLSEEFGLKPHMIDIM